MINNIKKIFYTLFIFLILIFHTGIQNASEILLYADNISYDKNDNIVARGNAKIFYDNKILTSNLIIYSKKNGDIFLPLEFSLKDERNNFYYGTSGNFQKNFKSGIINDVKVLLDDGSRIVGSQIKRNENIDIISKGVYSPCNSKIEIANFLCPIWQIEGEKMLHDYDSLFLYQKHSKMRVLNLPIFYTPYLVTPSPLRKKRKSGFLTPSINLNFFDTKVSQATQFPYYFNISIDKELTFTPTLNYGGGVDSSQRFNFDYNQLISGGHFSSYVTIDSTFENSNSDKWLKEGSLINKYQKNINENFNIIAESALQTSKNYIQQTNPNDELSYSSSLKSAVTINGYNLNKIDDRLTFSVSSYQSNQNNENNKTIPTVLPFITYETGKTNLNNYEINNSYELYNIFREKPTSIHSKEQRKFSYKFSGENQYINYHTNIKYKTEFYNQFFSVEDKTIDNKNVSSEYFRSFPIFGAEFETPFKQKNDRYNFIYTPKLQIVISPGQSNSNKLSNEDSSLNTYNITNNYNLNRFSGSDKLDNSKRINLSFTATNNTLGATIWQSYEFTNNSNFHYSQGNEKKLSDLLGEIKFAKDKVNSKYNIRYDPHDDYTKSQNFDLDYENNFGFYKLSYLDQKSKTADVITSDNETINYRLDTKKINKYSKISYFGLYDLKNEINKESGFSYSYFDECFGINLDFKRNSYTEDDLKPQDILTLMFSFKNVGSYKSTNLAVSETDKQDIEWENMSIDNDLFN